MQSDIPHLTSAQLHRRALRARVYRPPLETQVPVTCFCPESTVTGRVLPHDGGLMAQVLAGVEPGQLVIVHPSDEIEHGISITPRDES